MDTTSRTCPAWTTVRRILGRGSATQRLVLAAIPQATVAVDVSEQAVFVNAAAAALLGGTPDELTGRSLHGLLETVEADGGRVCAVCAALRTPEGHRGDSAVLRDSRAVVRWTAGAIIDRDEHVGAVLTLEREATISEIEQRHQERITREMQAMLADLAHELNNPLTVILAAAGMMREASEPELTSKRVNLIAEAAERCVGIVRTFRATLAPQPTTEPRGITPVTSEPAKAQILVVDDDPLVASAMSSALTAEGHEVDTATDGLAALARVSSRRYDVILTDVRMPRLDGPGFFQELGRLRPEMTSRVVFVTGDTLSAATRRFLEQCGAPSVRKPFEPRQLRAVVRRVLGGEERDIA